MNIEYLSTNVSVLLENSSDFDASVSNYTYDADETRKCLNQYDFHARNQLPTLGQ